MLAVDVSKYTGVVTPDVVAQWRAAGVGLVIIQAHPAGYGQERSIELARVVEGSGMPWDAYIYQSGNPLAGSAPFSAPFGFVAPCAHASCSK